MEYMTIKEAAGVWGVSTRAVTYHVVDGRIPGTVKKGNLWLIPASAEKPQDRRRSKQKAGAPE